MQAQLARLAAVDAATLPDGGERLRRRSDDLRRRIAELSPELLGSDDAPASSGSGLGGRRVQSAGADPGSRPQGSAPPAAGPVAHGASVLGSGAQPAGCQPGRADNRHAGPGPLLGLAAKAVPAQAGITGQVRPAPGPGIEPAGRQPHAATDSFLAALRTPLPGTAPAAHLGGSSTSSGTVRSGSGSGGSSSVAEPRHSMPASRAPACAGPPQRAAHAAQAGAGDAPAPSAVSRGAGPGGPQSAQEHAAPSVPPAAPAPAALAQPEPAAPLDVDAEGRACVQSGHPAAGLSQDQQGEAMRLSARVRAMKARLQTLLAVLGDAAQLAALPDGGGQARWPFSQGCRRTPSDYIVLSRSSQGAYMSGVSLYMHAPCFFWGMLLHHGVLL